jgi:hypothetical protein
MNGGNELSDAEKVKKSDQQQDKYQLKCGQGKS